MHFYNGGPDLPAALLFPSVAEAEAYHGGLIDGLMAAFETLGLDDDADHREILVGLIAQVQEDLEQEIKAILRHN